jgi:hypothetical protein
MHCSRVDDLTGVAVNKTPPKGGDAHYLRKSRKTFSCRPKLTRVALLRWLIFLQAV